MTKIVKIEIPQEVAFDFVGTDLKKHATAEYTVRHIVSETLHNPALAGIDKLRFKLCLLTCKGCGRFGIALVQGKNDGGYRITSHKCGGHWGSQEILDCAVWESEFDKYVKRSKK